MQTSNPVHDVFVSGEVIILTGPPGAGKTTVAGLLAANASVPTVNLTTDLFYRAIRTGFVRPYQPEAHRQNASAATCAVSRPGTSFGPVRASHAKRSRVCASHPATHPR